jgi:amino acid transporter
MVIFVYSLLFTSSSPSSICHFPDEVRLTVDNLISGIAMNLSGPVPLKLLFQAFVVIVVFLMLAGAANTAIIGSNGVLNRVSEDGVLTSWFRAPHRKYGTTHRMINMIVVLQVLTIVCSRGNVYLLGEAYAFGVVWSFAFNSIAILALGSKTRVKRMKVPEPRLGGRSSHRLGDDRPHSSHGLCELGDQKSQRLVPAGNRRVYDYFSARNINEPARHMAKAGLDSFNRKRDLE